VQVRVSEALRNRRGRAAEDERRAWIDAEVLARSIDQPPCYLSVHQPRPAHEEFLAAALRKCVHRGCEADA
jgi:hypothetical protein